MKIKSQIAVLVTFVILGPLCCAIILPVYHYYTSPKQYLLKGYEKVRSSEKLISVTEDVMKEKDWENLKSDLDKVPPGMETIVYINKNIVISTFREYNAGTVIEPEELFKFIRESADKYDYQIQSVDRKNNSKTIDAEKSINTQTTSYLLINRMQKVTGYGHENIYKSSVYLPIFAAFLIIESVFIYIIMQISGNISRSISILEESTQRIANGELDVKLDVPENKKVNNEITSLTENLEKMRCSLKDDQERRTRFIMGISHDLRTPVALIKGYTEAISDGVMNDPEKIKKSLSIITSKAEQLESMINELINYVKLDNTDWRSKLVPENIEPLIKNYAQTVSVSGDVYKRNIVIDVQVSEETRIPLDKTLFNRALENLLQNALRYSKENDTISVKAWENENYVYVSLGDTGMGMNKKDLDHMFDLFYRGTNSRREQGMGIGLSVVKNIADTHGWKINVESEENVGTTFTIEMPKKPSVKAAAQGMN